MVDEKARETPYDVQISRENQAQEVVVPAYYGFIFLKKHNTLLQLHLLFPLLLR
jgi:hypothetical protein